MNGDVSYSEKMDKYKKVLERTKRHLKSNIAKRAKQLHRPRSNKLRLSSILSPLLFTLAFFIMFFTDLNQFYIALSLLTFLTLYFIDGIFNVLGGYGKTKKLIRYIKRGLIVCFTLLAVFFNPISKYLGLDITIGAKIVFILLFPLYQWFFYKIYNKILPRQRRSKILRRIYTRKRQLVQFTKSISIDARNMFYLGVILGVASSALISHNFISLGPDLPSFLIINATIFALVLTISFSVVTNGEYTKIMKFDNELYTGWNLLYFLSYLAVIILDLFLDSSYMASATSLMVISSFAFISHLTEQTKARNLVKNLKERIKLNIDEGNYGEKVSIQRSYNWNHAKGFENKSIKSEEASDYRKNLHLLNQMALKSVEKDDLRVFKQIILSYFEIHDHLYGKGDKDNSSKLLARLKHIWREVKDNEDFRNAFLREVSHSYSIHTFSINPINMSDFREKNTQKFELMASLARNSEGENLDNVIYMMVTMLIDMIKQSEYGGNVTINGVSTEEYYGDWEDTEEFQILSELVMEKHEEIDLEYAFNPSINIDDNEKKQFVEDLIIDLKGQIFF